MGLSKKMGEPAYRYVTDKYGDIPGAISYADCEQLQSQIRSCGKDFRSVAISYNGAWDYWMDHEGTVVCERANADIVIGLPEGFDRVAVCDAVSALYPKDVIMAVENPVILVTVRSAAGYPQDALWESAVKADIESIIYSGHF